MSFAQRNLSWLKKPWRRRDGTDDSTIGPDSPYGSEYESDGDLRVGRMSYSRLAAKSMSVARVDPMTGKPYSARDLSDSNLSSGQHGDGKFHAAGGQRIGSRRERRSSHVIKLTDSETLRSLTLDSGKASTRDPANQTADEGRLGMSVLEENRSSNEESLRASLVEEEGLVRKGDSQGEREVLGPRLRTVSWGAKTEGWVGTKGPAVAALRSHGSGQLLSPSKKRIPNVLSSPDLAHMDSQDTEVSPEGFCLSAGQEVEALTSTKGRHSRGRSFDTDGNVIGVGEGLGLPAVREGVLGLGGKVRSHGQTYIPESRSAKIRQDSETGVGSRGIYLHGLSAYESIAEVDGTGGSGGGVGVKGVSGAVRPQPQQQPPVQHSQPPIALHKSAGAVASHTPLQQPNVSLVISQSTEPLLGVGNQASSGGRAGSDNSGSRPTHTGATCAAGVNQGAESQAGKEEGDGKVTNLTRTSLTKHALRVKAKSWGWKQWGRRLRGLPADDADPDSAANTSTINQWMDGIPVAGHEAAADGAAKAGQTAEAEVVTPLLNHDEHPELGMSTAILGSVPNANTTDVQVRDFKLKKDVRTDCFAPSWGILSIQSCSSSARYVAGPACSLMSCIHSFRR